MQFKISAEDSEKRLDKFLTENLSDFSRSQIVKKIETGEILVNSKKVKKHCFLKLDDVVSISQTKSSASNLEKENKKLFKKIKIISETLDYLVINKPAGLLVHAAENSSEKTLVDWLIENYPEVKKIKSLSAIAQRAKAEKLRPGIAHRLDRDVSGLMVIAKNKKSFTNLKKQFKDRKVQKIYTALVYGQVEPEEGTIDRPITRSKQKGIMIACTDEKISDAKPAVTDFEVLQRFDKKFTLLKIILHTGRTHQIRVHLKSIGHSIVGDTLYQTRDLKHKKLPHLENVFLCSTQLGFTDLTKNWQEFKIELPKNLKDFLKTIK